MNKTERYQAFAEKCAKKLAVTDKIVLRWAGGICKIGATTHAHCHFRDSEYPRGTICLNRKWFALASLELQRHCIAHEITHLAVKSPHRTPTFDRRMVTLGIANDTERRNARPMKKHMHNWRIGSYQVDGSAGLFRFCPICRRKEYLHESTRF